MEDYGRRTKYMKREELKMVVVLSNRKTPRAFLIG